MTELAETQQSVHKFIAMNGELRASCVVSTDVVREICQKHIASPSASIVMGRAISGALLLAANHKAGHRIGLELVGEGPLERVYVEATFEGGVRAYPQKPNAPMPMADENQGIGEAIGKGVLNVEMTFPSQDRPYRGSVELQTGEVGDDIAYYLYQSQQIPSIVSLGVLLDPHGQVIGAGGLLIELLPGHSEDTVLELEAQAIKAKSLLEGIMHSKSPGALLADYLEPFETQRLEHPHVVRHQCRCSLEKVLKSIKLFPRADLEQIAAEGLPQPVICEFCKERYEIPRSAIEKALDP